MRLDWNIAAGGQLRELRESRRLTQERLGDLSGVELRTIRRWENCKNKPDDLTFGFVAKVLLGPEATWKTLHDRCYRAPKLARFHEDLRLLSTLEEVQIQWELAQSKGQRSIEEIALARGMDVERARALDARARKILGERHGTFIATLSGVSCDDALAAWAGGSAAGHGVKSLFLFGKSLPGIFAGAGGIGIGVVLVFLLLKPCGQASDSETIAEIAAQDAGQPEVVPNELGGRPDAAASAAPNPRDTIDSSAIEASAKSNDSPAPLPPLGELTSTVISEDDIAALASAVTESNEPFCMTLDSVIQDSPHRFESLFITQFADAWHGAIPSAKADRQGRNWSTSAALAGFECRLVVGRDALNGKVEMVWSCERNLGRADGTMFVRLVEQVRACLSGSWEYDGPSLPRIREDGQLQGPWTDTVELGSSMPTEVFYWLRLPSGKDFPISVWQYGYRNKEGLILSVQVYGPHFWRRIQRGNGGMLKYE